MSRGIGDFVRSEIRKRVEAGMTRKECAEDMGVTVNVIRYYGIGVDFIDGPRGPRKSEKTLSRADEFKSRYLNGETIEQIALDHGITRERVRQILKNVFGVTGADGGRSVIVARKKADALAKKNEHYLKWRGMTAAEYASVPKWAKVKWQMSRRDARSIFRSSWEISFRDWYDLILPHTANGEPPPRNLWLERIDASKPFSIGNVRFTSAKDVLVRKTSKHPFWRKRFVGMAGNGIVAKTSERETDGE